MSARDEDLDALLFDRIERDKGYRDEDCPDGCDCPACMYADVTERAEDLS